MTCLVFFWHIQRPPFLPPPMGNMPPPPGMIFPPGMHPVPAAGGTAAEEIWVENNTPEGKVLTPSFYLRQQTLGGRFTIRVRVSVVGRDCNYCHSSLL